MYLQERGATITDQEDPDRAAFRSGLGLPDEVGSCHTTVVEGYAIEGHVPAEAIVKLLDTKPDAVGIALPGMPFDSPGMGGDEETWANQPVVLVDADGNLTPFSY